MLDITFAEPSLPRDGALALLIPEGARPAGLWAQLDEATGGAITRALEAGSFTGKKGQTCLILAPGAGLARIVAVGLGTEVTESEVERAGGAAAVALARDATAAFAADQLAPEQAAAAAMGAVLRSYRFDRYRTKEKPEDKPKLTGI